jgi:hypothetical protein
MIEQPVDVGAIVIGDVGVSSPMLVMRRRRSPMCRSSAATSGQS